MQTSCELIVTKSKRHHIYKYAVMTTRVGNKQLLHACCIMGKGVFFSGLDKIDKSLLSLHIYNEISGRASLQMPRIFRVSKIPQPNTKDNLVPIQMYKSIKIKAYQKFCRL